MRLRLALAPLMVLISLAAMAAANAGAPNFSPAIYADGDVWGTKGLSEIPAPNSHNTQSFDKLFIIVNGAPGQLPVAEAAPRNPAFNGGRWFTQTAMWTAAGIAAHNPLPVIMSYGDLKLYEGMGQIAVAPGSPNDTTPDYFECPLLPVH